LFGLLSTSGLFEKERQPWIYKVFVETGEARVDDDMATALGKVLRRTNRLIKGKGGVFGINVMVSAELIKYSRVLIDMVIRVRQEDHDMKDHFKVVFTSAGDPVGWAEKMKGAGFTWIHVVPSVKAALRCKKAGVDVIVASGHEGGFHVSWEPVHSMVLLPAVVDAVSDGNTLVAGAGGFCDGRTLAAALILGADTTVYEGDKEKAMMAAGEAAQRIKTMSRVNDLVQEMVKEAEAVFSEVPKKVIA
jgi:NAD(P)H-dependent flavin oxidoreductase YrpB (nitropropane dioxygenase family)